MNETIGTIMIWTGAAFDLVGCVGLVRLPDVYNRLQAATKCVTLGTCLILGGVAVSAGFGNVPLLIKALLCAFFILLTSPVGAHALARGAYRSGVKLCDGSVADEYADSEAFKRFQAAAPQPDPSHPSHPSTLASYPAPKPAGPVENAQEQPDAQTETA